MSRSEILAKFADHGILSTPQRLEVAEILLRKPQHMSAEQIIDKLHDNGSTVSKATVYNTLKLFDKYALIKELAVDSERRIYDSATHPHHHFYDVDTGVLTDIPADKVKFSNMPEMPAGTTCQEIDLIIRVRSSPE